MKKLKTANEILDKKYGKIGSNSRAKFTEEAYAYYLSEVLKNRRKELKLTQVRRKCNNKYCMSDR